MTKPKQRWGWISKMRLGAARAALTLVVVLGLGVVAAQSAQAQTFTVLYSFTGSPDGAYPYAGLLRDTAGNLYGTTSAGGTSGYGTVFKVNTSDMETVLYKFKGLGKGDGQNPYAGVIMDAAGNLYGTATYGGGGCGSFGCGTVFKVSKTGKETVLHFFAGAKTDGAYPSGALIQDAKGTLYGTTEVGGVTEIFGTVFKVSKAGKETVLHSFADGSSDGALPSYASVLMDTKGNFYGDTFEGGASQSSGGVVYKLGKSGVLTVLHSFGNGTDGFEAYGTPVMDTRGNLYGTSYRGGFSGYGAVWKLGKKGTETVLHSFAGTTSDGAWPEAGVIVDAKGNLYGVTTAGGSGTCGSYGCGTVYELNTKGVLTVLHNFAGADGEFPTGSLILDANGSLYGTTVYGGSSGYGTVWKLTP